MSNFFKRILYFKICKKEINYNIFKPWKWKKLSFKKILIFLIVVAVFSAACITLKDEYNYQFGDYYYEDDEEGYYDEEYEDDWGCNVTGIELHGNVVTYISPGDIYEDGSPMYDEVASENVVFAIESADQDEEIKAIILEVDSYGGSAVAAEEIAEAMKRANKPTVALVRTAAVSASYWASTGADIIFASNLSDIGSIGVTMSYLDSSKQNIKDGLTYNSLSTGKFKDYGDSEKPLTLEERGLLMRDLNIMHDNFVKAVAENRGLDINKVRALADGSSMPGQMALDNGLIDKIGGMAEVKEYLKERIGGDVEICW